MHKTNQPAVGSSVEQQLKQTNKQTWKLNIKKETKRAAWQGDPRNWFMEFADTPRGLVSLKRGLEKFFQRVLSMFKWKLQVQEQYTIEC